MDFRIFHVNRMKMLKRTDESFRPRRVPLIREYMANRRAEMEKLLQTECKGQIYPGRTDKGPAL